MGHHPEEKSNASKNASFESILKRRVSRRDILRGGVSTAALAMLPSFPLAGCEEESEPLLLGFEAVQRNNLDRVTVPAGYRASVLYAFGDPIAAGLPAFGNTGAEGDFDKRAGDQHDAIAFFGISDDGAHDGARSDRGLLVMNHEQLLDQFLHADGPTVDAEGRRPKTEVDKELFAHGVSIVEVRKETAGWVYLKDSAFNRRITGVTPMDIRGPARGSALLATRFSAAATSARGTLNNCAHGVTPWGTYLACEENWFSYFKRDDDLAARSAADNALMARYGIGAGARGFSYRSWDTVEGDLYARFDLTATGASAVEDFRNEASQFGYCVEIDPFSTASTPQKRTALGRFAHEGAWFGPVRPGEPLVVYMGDDSRFEYIYKFVSTE
ncbi:MAG: DUF839 domain-containing protein, partial [Polyangiaceae bacterium]|nr:DUF839 domain-containing protein [Polyangiaceae bacterium]